MFSKQLIDYTESTFKEAKIDIQTKTMVKEVKEKSILIGKLRQEGSCSLTHKQHIVFVVSQALLHF